MYIWLTADRLVNLGHGRCGEDRHGDGLCYRCFPIVAEVGLVTSLGFGKEGVVMLTVGSDMLAGNSGVVIIVRCRYGGSVRREGVRGYGEGKQGEVILFRKPKGC